MEQRWSCMRQRKRWQGTGKPQDEANRKPGSVPPLTPAGGDDHSSGTHVTVCLERPNPEASGELPLSHVWSTVGPGGSASLFGLAPGGVYRASNVTIGTGALLPHRFTLTRTLRAAVLHAAMLHTPSCRGAHRPGGLFSVALSLGSPPLDVIQHPALWSPDFPPLAVWQGAII